MFQEAHSNNLISICNNKKCYLICQLSVPLVIISWRIEKKGNNKKMMMNGAFKCPALSWRSVSSEHSPVLSDWLSFWLTFRVLTQVLWFQMNEQQKILLCDRVQAACNNKLCWPSCLAVGILIDAEHLIIKWISDAISRGSILNWQHGDKNLVWIDMTRSIDCPVDQV